MSQRFVAYPLVNTPLVIQFDDDISFDRYFISSLISRFLSLPFNSILAPALFEDGVLRSTSVYPKPLFSSILYFIATFNLKQPFGSLTPSGYPIGFSLRQKRYLDTDFIPVEWCPGASIIHHTQNLLPYNYYKLNGKAYSEDLVHCTRLKENNIFTFIDPTLRVNTFDNQTNSLSSLHQFFKSRYFLYNSLRAHQIKFSPVLFILFTFFYFFSKICSLILHRFHAKK